jgi:SAM-dependent methyltransferase
MPTLLQRARAKAARAKAIAQTRMPINGEFPRFHSLLEASCFTSFGEYQDWAANHKDRLAQWITEDDEAIGVGDTFTVPGFCALCDREIEFAAATTNAGEHRINWREHLVCPSCHMCNRVRAALQLGIQEFGLTADSSIYITEQLGTVYRFLRGRFDTVTGSEYLSPDLGSGRRRLGINHQDIEDLRLPRPVDAIITFDVLEHVPHPQAAFHSFAQSLRPGGRLIMTAPFTINKYETTTRAVLHDDGQIEHFLPIEIHGNPLDPDAGSLCFRHFGWDVLEQLADEGLEAKVCVYHDRRLGHLGGPQSLISAIRR